MLIIGHLCIDEKIINGKKMPLELGSSVAYASISSVKNNYTDNIETKMVTKIGVDFPNAFLKFLKKNNLNLDYIIRADCISTRYILEYVEEERVSMKLGGLCEKITKEDIPIELINESSIIYFALIANEIELDIFKWIKIKFPDKLTCLDIQGILRHVKPDKTIYLEANEKIIESLKYIDIIKMADYEAKVLVEDINLEKIAVKTSEFGPKIVIITNGYKGSMIYDSEKKIFHKIPAVIPKKVIDVTGTGDVYFSSFLSEYYKTKDLKHSGLYAATFVSFLVQKEGLKGIPTRDQTLINLNKLIKKK